MQKKPTNLPANCGVSSRSSLRQNLSLCCVLHCGGVYTSNTCKAQGLHVVVVRFPLHQQLGHSCKRLITTEYAQNWPIRCIKGGTQGKPPPTCRLPAFSRLSPHSDLFFHLTRQPDNRRQLVRSGRKSMSHSLQTMRTINQSRALRRQTWLSWMIRKRPN